MVYPILISSSLSLDRIKFDLKVHYIVQNRKSISGDQIMNNFSNRSHRKAAGIRLLFIDIIANKVHICVSRDKL